MFFLFLLMYVTLQKKASVTNQSVSYSFSQHMFVLQTQITWRLWSRCCPQSTMRIYTNTLVLFFGFVFCCWFGFFPRMHDVYTQRHFVLSVLLYSNKGVLLVSTAYSKMIKPRHCPQLILSPIIPPIQRCSFSSSFKASTRALLNLSTRTLLYRQVTNHLVPEAFKIVFRLL